MAAAGESRPKVGDPADRATNISSTISTSTIILIPASESRHINLVGYAFDRRYCKGLPSVFETVDPAISIAWQSTCSPLRLLGLSTDSVLRAKKSLVLFIF